MVIYNYRVQENDKCLEMYLSFHNKQKELSNNQFVSQMILLASYVKIKPLVIPFREGVKISDIGAWHQQNFKSHLLEPTLRQTL